MEGENKRCLTLLVKDEIRLVDALDILRIINHTLFLEMVAHDSYQREVYLAHEREVGGGIKWYS